MGYKIPVFVTEPVAFKSYFTLQKNSSGKKKIGSKFATFKANFLCRNSLNRKSMNMRPEAKWIIVVFKRLSTSFNNLASNLLEPKGLLRVARRENAKVENGS
jgi:hypothetical protein